MLNAEMYVPTRAALCSHLLPRNPDRGETAREEQQGGDEMRAEDGNPNPLAHEGF